MFGKEFQALEPPPEVLTRGGDEFLRVSFSDNGLCIAMKRGFTDPETWGQVFATLARQAAQLYADEGDGPFDLMLERIGVAFARNILETEDADQPAQRNAQA